MDLTSIITTVLALSVLVERLLEATFSLVELRMPRITGDATSVSAQQRAQAEKYAATKRVASTLLGIVLGAVVAAVLGIGVFGQIGITAISSAADTLLTGAIAGALSPYSHQLIEGFFDLRAVLKGVAENRRQDAMMKASVRSQAESGGQG